MKTPESFLLIALVLAILVSNTGFVEDEPGSTGSSGNNIMGSSATGSSSSSGGGTTSTSAAQAAAARPLDTQAGATPGYPSVNPLSSTLTLQLAEPATSGSITTAGQTTATSITSSSSSSSSASSTSAGANGSTPSITSSTTIGNTFSSSP